MKIINLAVLSVVAISIASAGQIEIGANTTAGVSTGGLTSGYVGGGAGSWSDSKGYMANLFTGDTITAGTSSLGGTNLPTASAGFQQFTDTKDGVTFAMDTDASGTDNYWGSPASNPTTSSSITIPVGVFDVGGTNILLNDYWGVTGQQDTIVTFNFANAGAVSFTLTNGNQIDSAQNCSANSPSWNQNTVTSNCTGFARSTTSPNTDIAWSANYTNATSNTTPFSGTSGVADLIDIGFNLTSVANYTTDTLNSITITDQFNTNDTITTADPSRLALSAITVETGPGGPGTASATPEPSTVVMLMTGLGMVAYLGKRRKARV